MLKKILLVIVGVIAIFCAVVTLQPAEFFVSRSAAMAALPDAVFAQVNDLHRWEQWSPWAKIDPNAKTYYEGPPSGTGAAFGWSGNNELGEGKMTITESRPDELVRFRLDFVRPFAGTSNAEFTFKPEGSGTVVSWSMSGTNHFIAKAIGLFMDCDAMVGGYFENGLSRLREIVEGQRAATAP